MTTMKNINNNNNLPTFTPFLSQYSWRGVWEAFKPLCLCNTPVHLNPKKWATAMNGQSPDPSLNLSSLFDRTEIKTEEHFNNHFFINLIIKNITNVCILKLANK